MQMKTTSKHLLLLCLVLCSLGLPHCSQKETTVPNPSEEHLRKRIVATYDHFLNGHFEDFIKMRSDRKRQTLFESDAEKREMIEKLNAFLTNEKPTAELLAVEVAGHRATAKMHVTVLREDGSRSSSTLYDLWVFENGDWYLDDANRASPEYLRED